MNVVGPDTVNVASQYTDRDEPVSRVPEPPFQVETTVNGTGLPPALRFVSNIVNSIRRLSIRNGLPRESHSDAVVRFRGIADRQRFRFER